MLAASIGISSGARSARSPIIRQLCACSLIDGNGREPIRIEDRSLLLRYDRWLSIRILPDDKECRLADWLEVSPFSLALWNMGLDCRQIADYRDYQHQLPTEQDDCIKVGRTPGLYVGHSLYTSGVISIDVRPALEWAVPGIITRHTIITGLYDRSTGPPPHQTLISRLSSVGRP